MMRILILVNYPISVATHGGQIRTKHIVNKYLKEGHSVEVVGIFSSSSYLPERGFLKYPREEIERYPEAIEPQMHDYLAGRVAYENEELFTGLSRQILSPPDLIQIVQPWMLKFALKYRGLVNPKAKLVYDSQNIEWKLKAELFQARAMADEFSETIRQLEHDAMRESDLVIAVSEDDAKYIREQTESTVICAPNGVAKKNWTARDMFKELKDIKYALFAGSAHPPNVEGFFAITQGGFSSLDPDQKLVVVGDVGHAILTDYRLKESVGLKERLFVTGKVSDAILGALVEHAHCFILPITKGGGTNLKTAEALLSKKWIVSTNAAMRGFDAYRTQNGVLISDEPGMFKKQLRWAMSQGSPVLTREEEDSRVKVSWEETLDKLKFISRFVND